MRRDNKLDNENNYCLSSCLLEIDRKNLVGKTKVQSPERYNKRLSYSPKSYKDIDAEQLLQRDILVTTVPVGDYVCTVAYAGVLSELLKVVRSQPKPNVTLQSVIKAVTRSIDKTDVYVDCTCPDFKYRYAYWATKYGYKYGKPETRPARKTNPDDKIGSMCKHLTSLLSNKKWLIKLSSIVNDFIKNNIEDVRKSLDVSPEEFIVNTFGRPSLKTNRNTSMINKSNFDNTSNSKNNIEDLELNISNER